MKDLKTSNVVQVIKNEDYLESYNQFYKAECATNEDEKRASDLAKRCVVVAEGEERAYLNVFYNSVTGFIDKCYKARSSQKTALDFLVDKAMQTAVLKEKETTYIDMSKLGFTNGTGVSRKLRNLKLKRGFKVSMRWNAFKPDFEEGVQNGLVVFTANPALKECTHSELLITKRENESREVIVTMLKDWESHNIHFWAFWYQITADGVVNSSKSQYVGAITLLKK